jgi:acetate---CoA ligase (ADP-forming)
MTAANDEGRPAVSTDALTRLMRPRSIAIVGVSPEPRSPGGAALGNLERFGYQGGIHLVSRTHTEVGGRACVGTIDELSEGIDLAILMIPRAAIEEAIAACARRRVGAAIIFAAGFAEAGDVWKSAQDRIAAIAREAGIALCGPNCLGIMNYVDAIPMTFSSQPPSPKLTEPALSVVAQSGGLAVVVRTALQAKGLPVAFTVSTGNEAVVGLEDYLDFLIEDEGTCALAVFAEQIRHPARFLVLARRARQVGKPIVLLHPGRSAAARASALSHTGALAGDHDVMRALVAHEGVAFAHGIDELIDISELMVRFPAAPIAGAAVATDSGAFKGVTLDLCESIELELPQLSAVAAEKLKAELPEFVEASNPVDLTAQAIVKLDLYTRVLSLLLADQRFGSVVAAPIIGLDRNLTAAKVHAILPARSAAAKPLIFALLGDEVPMPEDLAAEIRSAGVPLFRSPERALRALAAVTAAARARVAASARRPPPAANAPGLPVGVTLPEHRSKAYLADFGIPMPRGRLAVTVTEAAAVAAEIGYPVALKVQASALTHKTDAGGVVLGVSDAARLAEDWASMADNVKRRQPDIAIEGVLVEAMAASGLEMIVGARRDPDWGPVIVVGLGGIWAEALHDVRLLAPDLNATEIETEIRRLKGAKLFDGLRGQPARDVEALVKIVSRLASLICARPEIREIDLNPVVVFARGAGALPVDALIITQ